MGPACSQTPRPADGRGRVGFAGMSASADFDAFVPAGLASLGIEADDAEIAVMRATHGLYWPALVMLLDVDLSGVDPEPAADMSRPPEPA
jgi:hypothetical protein